MSSSDSERRTIFGITEGLPIPELIKLIKHSYREREYDELERILMDREEKTKIEIENLVREKEKLEETQGLAELENLKTKDIMKRSCKELKATIARLREEKNVSIDRHLKNEKMYNEVSAYNSRIEEALRKMEEEIENLRREKSAADETVAELRRQNSEANRTIDELRRKENLESDKECEVCKSQKLAPRIGQIEEILSRIFKVKVEDLKNFVEENFGDVMDENGNFGENGTLGNGDDDDDDGDDVVVLSPADVVRDNSSSNGDGCTGLSKKGGINSVHSEKKDDGSNLVERSLVLHCDPRQQQNDVSDQDNEANMPQILEREELQGSAQPHAGLVDIIDLDSDDETNPIGRAHTSDTVIIGANAAVENDIISEKSAQNSQSKKRNRADDYTEDSRYLPNNENENQDRIGASDSQTPSSDSEPLSDSGMEAFIASLMSEKIGWKFMLEADMINAFQEDDQLCLSAVCALYRHQFFEISPSAKRSKSVKSDDAVSGRNLAEYLISGDEKMRLRKSVSEVKKERPEVISQCQRLAATYSEKLFEIYCSKKDPFFSRT